MNRMTLQILQNIISKSEVLIKIGVLSNLLILFVLFDLLRVWDFFGYFFVKCCYLISEKI